MWSVSNEARSEQPGAEEYFRDVINYTRELDSKNNRPITAVTDRAYNVDTAAQFVDILAINRYFSWYSDTGHTEVIRESMILDVENWVRTFNKPIMVSEYGADTITGMHQSPDFVFTEEYQSTFMKEHFKAFDYLRANSSFIGEHIWNFADFMTRQDYTRVLGNKKGVFTRERQPKASAHLLRYRFHLLAQESDNYTMPADLGENVPVYTPVRRIVHDEH
jgi:beta-glucuronidase